MATFGKTTDGTSASGSTSTATKVAVSRAVPAQTGPVTTGHAQMSFSAANNVRFAIYADAVDGLGPGTPLAVSDVVSLSGAMAWRTFTFSGANLITVTAGTPYWIGPAWQSGPTTTYQRDAESATDVTTMRRESGTSSWTWPDPTPSSWNAGQVGPMAAYVTYSTGTVYAKTGGAAGIGAGSGAKSIGHSIPKTGGAAASGAGSGAKVLGTAVPAEVYNLTRWHWTLPTEDPGPDTDAAQIDQPALATYFDANFYVDANGYIVCTAPVNGFTTSGSGGTRSEGREHENNYANSAWDPNTTGLREFTITTRANPTSITGGTNPRQEEIIYQIHGASGTPPIYFAAEWTSNGVPVDPARIRMFVSGTGMSNANVVTGITTDTPITIRVRVVNAQLTAWVVAGQVADLPVTPTFGPVATSDFNDQVAWYFKAGAYNKTEVSSGSSGQSVARISYWNLIQPGDATVYAKTGGAAGIGAGSGAKAVTPATVHAKSGGAAAAAAGTGAREYVHVKTGGAAAPGAGIGTRTLVHDKTGGAAAEAAGTGTKSVIMSRTGGAAAVGAGSGVKDLDSVTVHNKTGGASAVSAGSGAREHVRPFVGGAAASGAGSGAKTVTPAAVHVKTGGAAALGAGSGTKVVDAPAAYTKAGGGVAIGAGSGASEVQHPTTYDKAGGGAATGTATGARQRLRFFAGGAAAVGAGSGVGELVPPTVHAKSGGAVSTGAGIGDVDVTSAAGHVRSGGAAARGAGSGAKVLVPATVYVKSGGSAAAGAGIGLKQVIPPTVYAKTGGAAAVGAGIGRGRVGGAFFAAAPRLAGTRRAAEPVAAITP